MRSPTPPLTVTESFTFGQTPRAATRFVTPVPFRVNATEPAPTNTQSLKGTSERYAALVQTLVVVQPTHYYNATLTRQASIDLATWQAAPTYTLTPTQSIQYQWLNGCCWGYWDGAGWVLLPTPASP